MKGIKLNVITLLVFLILTTIKSLEERNEEKLQEIQKILDIKNPNCVKYRDAVNSYFREIAPYRKCQLQCNNNDKEYSSKFENWYIPNDMPGISGECEKMADNCNYKFDSEELFGSKFYDVMLDAEIFVSLIMDKSYLTLCM